MYMYKDWSMLNDSIQFGAIFVFVIGSRVKIIRVIWVAPTQIFVHILCIQALSSKIGSNS